MRAYEHGSTWTLDHGQMNCVSFVTIRDCHRATIVAAIEARHATDPSRPVDVLEVGGRQRHKPYGSGAGAG